VKLTVEQRAAVLCDENVLLTACPGSGKTRAVVSKLLRTIDLVRGTPRAVACITYTNAAVQEIEVRLRRNLQTGDDPYFDVSTIHSFCIKYIFRPFCYRVSGYERGFKILTQDSEAFREFVVAVCAESNRYDLRYRDFDEFAQLQADESGEPIGASITSGGVQPEEALRFWTRIRDSGYVDFPSLLFQSLDLLRNHPEIADYVASRFRWILVDEFQDTSALQVEILSLIAARARTQFFLVGDPLQSIFGFAGARPDLAKTFAARIGARTDFALSGNFRSSPGVVRHAEVLIPRVPPMQAVGPAKRFPEVPMYRCGGTAFEVLVDDFLPTAEGLGIPLGEVAVLAPTWFSLFPLGRQFREYGVPVVGPGARPYKRNRLFAPMAEQVCGYFMEPRAEAIVGIERTLFNTVLEATGRSMFEIRSYSGRRAVFQLLAEARRLHALHAGAMEWLDAAAVAFSDVMEASGYLTHAESTLLPSSVEEMRADMVANKVDISNLGLEDLGVYASPAAAMKLSTLHYSKGREYTAVAIIDLHEGRLPFYRATSDAEIEEARRLLYVGITRARRLLIYVTDRSDLRNVPSRFLLPGSGIGVC
jgi:DNA helicase-2/ATP-dependent DNA helicase PcrA